MSVKAMWAGQACGTYSLRDSLLYDDNFDDTTIKLMDEVHPTKINIFWGELDNAGFLVSCDPETDGAISSDTADLDSNYHVYNEGLESHSLMQWRGEFLGYYYDGDMLNTNLYGGAGSSSSPKRIYGGYEASHSYGYSYSSQGMAGPSGYKFLGQAPTQTGTLYQHYHGTYDADYDTDNISWYGTSYGGPMMPGYTPDGTSPVPFLGWQAHSNLSSPTVVHTEPSGWYANETCILATCRWSSNMVILYTANATTLNIELVVMKWNETTTTLDVLNTFDTGLTAPSTHLCPMGPALIKEFVGNNTSDHYLLVGFPFWNGGSKTNQGQIRAYTVNESTGALTLHYTYDSPVPARNGHFGKAISCYGPTLDISFTGDAKFSAGQLDTLWQIYGEGTSKGSVAYTNVVSRSDIGEQAFVQKRNGQVLINGDTGLVDLWENGVEVPTSGSNFSTYTPDYSGFLHPINSGFLTLRNTTAGTWEPYYAVAWFTFGTDVTTTRGSAYLIQEPSNTYYGYTSMRASGIIEPHPDVFGASYSEYYCLVDHVAGRIYSRPCSRPDNTFSEHLPVLMGSTAFITTDDTSAQMLYDSNLGNIIVNFGRLSSDNTKIAFDVFKEDWNYTYDSTVQGANASLHYRGDAYIETNETGKIDIDAYASLDQCFLQMQGTLSVNAVFDIAVFYSFDGILWSYSKDIAPQYTRAQCFADHMTNGDHTTLSTRLVGLDLTNETWLYFLILFRSPGLPEGNADFSYIRYADYIYYMMTEKPGVQELILAGCSDHPNVTSWEYYVNEAALSNNPNLEMRMYFSGVLGAVDSMSIGWPGRELV